MPTTKQDIIDQVCSQTGLTKAQARDITETILKIFKNTLIAGEDVMITGFGKFTVRQKDQRMGRNPQTKANLRLPARKVVTFKTSGALRQRMNEGQN